MKQYLLNCKLPLVPLSLSPPSPRCRPSLFQRSFRSFGNDDRHVIAKHSTIYPSSEELGAVQSLVSTVECALKHVSDWMDQSSHAQTETDGQPADSTEEDDPGDPAPSSEDSNDSSRLESNACWEM